jgi:hypothetical protein
MYDWLKNITGRVEPLTDAIDGGDKAKRAPSRSI